VEKNALEQVRRKLLEEGNLPLQISLGNWEQRWILQVVADGAAEKERLGVHPFVVKRKFVRCWQSGRHQKYSSFGDIIALCLPLRRGFGRCSVSVVGHEVRLESEGGLSVMIPLLLSLLALGHGTYAGAKALIGAPVR
jgi:hypothetical protein